jgi:hypothetical protein
MQFLKSKSGPPFSVGFAACEAIPRHTGTMLRTGTSSDTARSVDVNSVVSAMLAFTKVRMPVPSSWGFGRAGLATAELAMWIRTGYGALSAAFHKS